MADGWIELFDVETDGTELLFVFDRFEPVDYGCGVFPLVEVAFFRHCAVDAVKKSQPETTQAIHKENKAIATKLRIDDRVDTTADKDAFIALKDHKPNFANKPSCRLINPTKSEIDKISKNILDRINSTIYIKHNHI